MAMLLGEIGLFPGQEQALQVLAQHDNGMTMGELSRTLHVRPPTASKTIARLTAQGLEPAGNSPADFATMIRAEIAKYAKIVKAAGIKAE